MMENIANPASFPSQSTQKLFMNKMLSILFFVFLAVGCSSAPVPGDGPKPLFMMPTVDLTLNQVRQHSQYPDQSGLATLFQEKLKGALEKMPYWQRPRRLKPWLLLSI